MPSSLRHLLFILALGPVTAIAQPALRPPRVPAPVEVHQRLDVREPGHERDVALTLDACGGEVDRALLDTLVRLQVPATIFMTRRWIDRNAEALRLLRAHPHLFALENHGAAHVPAVVGRTIYHLHGAPTLEAVEREVVDGAAAVAQADDGHAPAWYRGATAVYDAQSEALIGRLGYRIAGFSVNADDGATLTSVKVARRLQKVQPGDIVIAHMNHPRSGTAAGFATALPALRQRGIVFVKLSPSTPVLAKR